MNSIKLFQVSSLEKVFWDYSLPEKEYTSMSAFKNEKFSYQIACMTDVYPRVAVRVSVKSPLEKYITLRTAENVVVDTPVHPGTGDENYLRTDPGLYPDLLCELRDSCFELAVGRFKGLWVTMDTKGEVAAGEYPVEITISGKSHDGTEYSASKTMNVEIINAQLPPQELIFTQWFHCDCLASYYKVDVFSEEHWNLIDKFMKTAVENGINMILTPVFTPPLDTAVGGERPTVQLVAVTIENGKYLFDFSKLLRWISLCKKNGIKYYEISHLFTQWGALYTPKIMAWENGVEKRIFGWDVSATSNEYKGFMDSFLPALIEVLKEEGIDKNTYFHISDEPNETHIDQYKAAKAVVEEHLKDFTIIDALSRYEFYKQDIVKNPIPGNNHMEEFIENGVENLWTYYCTSQRVEVSNRFIAMPSYRNRVIGSQFYKFDIKGFLQWGYNFYYSQHSRYLINPFMVTDSMYAFPSGDPFSVYPGEDGPIEALRLLVFYDAIQDLRAMRLLESFIGREAVIGLIEDEAEMEITFKKYPHSSDFVLNLREKINMAIKSHL